MNTPDPVMIAIYSFASLSRGSKKYASFKSKTLNILVLSGMSDESWSMGGRGYYIIEVMCVSQANKNIS